MSDDSITPSLTEFPNAPVSWSPQDSETIAEAEGGDGSAGSGLIPDPIGGSDEEYKDTFEVLQTLIEQALQRVEPEVAK